MSKRPSQCRKARQRTGSESKFDDWSGWSIDHATDGPEVDPESDFPGTTYIVPDKFWGFRSVGREDHPGACTQCATAEHVAILVKGSDALLRRSFAPTFVIEPTPENGLRKATAFELVPRAFRLRRLLLLHENRRAGRLDPLDLSDLQRALERRFPPVP
jgi:hypothetical protein